MSAVVKKKSRAEFYLKIAVALVLYLMAILLIVIDSYYDLGLKSEYMMLILGSEVSVASAVLIDALTSGKDVVKYEQSQGLKIKKVVIESEEP